MTALTSPPPPPLLFTALRLREVALRNRTMLSPMCTYSATDGLAGDWHLAHLGQFALGGFAIVCVEATAVTEQGRITYGDVGIWSRAHVAPQALDVADIRALIAAWRDAAARARDAGFDIVEIHGAHGYLNHQFLSPLINKRNDGYGGDRAGRMRFPLEVAQAVRAEWPKEKPVFCRVSAVDGIEGGWDLDDSVAFARELKRRGVDAVDCSSGGVVGSATARAVPRGLGFQVPFAAHIRREAQIATIAVGLILTGSQGDDVLRRGEADLIAVAREALFDPYWPRHAARALGADAGGFADWPQPYGWWLDKREATLRRLVG